jgi:3-methyladenine DNA glycosylase AlkD
VATASKHTADRTQYALDWLKRHGSKSTREAMARYNIPSDKAFGVPMRQIQELAKQLGRDHELAAALWSNGSYEARLLAAYVDEPSRVTAAQMDRWSREFDNWAICDTVCFALFDRTPYAWRKVETWAGRRSEYVKRGAFALLWSLTVHDKASGNAPFLRGLTLIERAATDDRHFVKKAVNMALRAVGKRNAVLNTAAAAVASRLSASSDKTAHWVGKHALGELTSTHRQKR